MQYKENIMKKINDFINAVKDEKEGFILDEPWRLNEETLFAIVPILRKSKKKRKYIMLAEAKDVQIEDTGQIAYVYVKNNEEKPLFVSRGTIFRGKTQERAAIHGHLIQPGKGMRVSVRCVHASKGIKGKAEMEYAGITGYGIDLSTQSRT